MRWCVVVALGLTACATPRTVMRVADPRQVSLADAATGRVVIPADAPPLTSAEVAPGVTVIRGTEGQLAASCWRCRVDDRDAGGVWVFADGTTEALPADAQDLAAEVPRGELRIPVRASRSLGRRRSVGVDLLLITPSSNVLEIREEKHVDHVGSDSATFLEVVGVFNAVMAAISFGTLPQALGPADRVVLISFGGLFSAAATALFTWALIDPHLEDGQSVSYRASGNNPAIGATGER